MRSFLGFISKSMAEKVIATCQCRQPPLLAAAGVTNVVGGDAALHTRRIVVCYAHLLPPTGPRRCPGKRMSKKTWARAACLSEPRRSSAGACHTLGAKGAPSPRGRRRDFPAALRRAKEAERRSIRQPDPKGDCWDTRRDPHASLGSAIEEGFAAGTLTGRGP